MYAYYKCYTPFCVKGSSHTFSGLFRELENVNGKKPPPKTGPYFIYTYVLYKSLYACTRRLPTRENAAERCIPVLSRRWPRAG